MEFRNTEYCSCGAKIEEGAHFCEECGARVYDESNEKNPEDETIEDVLKTFNEKQKAVLFYIVGQIVESYGKEPNKETNSSSGNNKNSSAKERMQEKRGRMYEAREEILRKKEEMLRKRDELFKILRGL